MNGYSVLINLSTVCHNPFPSLDQFKRNKIWRDNDDDDEEDNEDAIVEKSSAFHERIHSPFHYDILRQVEEAKHPFGGVQLHFRSSSGKSSQGDESDDKEERRGSLTLTRTVSSRAGRAPQVLVQDLFTSALGSDSSGSMKSTISGNDSYTNPQTADRFSFPDAASPVPASASSSSAAPASASVKFADLKLERPSGTSTGSGGGGSGGVGGSGGRGQQGGGGSMGDGDLQSYRNTLQSPTAPALPGVKRDATKEDRGASESMSSSSEGKRRGRDMSTEEVGLDVITERLNSYISDSTSSSFQSAFSPPSASDCSLPMTVSSPFTLRLDVSGDSDTVSEIDETVKAQDYPDTSPLRPQGGSPVPAEDMSSLNSRNRNSNTQQQQRRQQRGDSKAVDEETRSRGRGDGYTSQSLSPTPSTSTSASPYSPLLTPSSSRARTTKHTDRKSYGGV